MASNSDIPYVQGPNGPERSNPVVIVNKGDWTDKSGTTGAANAVTTLFPAAARDANGDRTDFTTLSRFVCHVGTSGTIWVNFLGGQAAKNTPGSLPLKPGVMLEIPTDAAVTITGDEANIPYTAAVC